MLQDLSLFLHEIAGQSITLASDPKEAEEDERLGVRLNHYACCGLSTSPKIRMVAVVTPNQYYYFRRTPTAGNEEEIWATPHFNNDFEVVAAESGSSYTFFIQERRSGWIDNLHSRD